MSSFNHLTLMGRLTRDPQLKYLPSQTAIVEFSVATSEKYKTQAGEQREETCFTDCKLFGKRAEIVNQYFKKGSPILVSGKLAQDVWDDKQTGQKRSKHYMKVDDFQFVGGRVGNDSDQPSDDDSY